MGVRFAVQEDLGQLAAIEADADRLFVERFTTEDWDQPMTGVERAAMPGFLLVATEGHEVVGFAHVLEEGGAHLAQVAVLRAAGRRGHGAALVRAVLTEAGRRGFDRVTLETYADVPWNAPFYARLGFVEIGPAPDPGLERWGRRVRMSASSGVGGAR